MPLGRFADKEDKMRAQLKWAVGLNTFEICVMNANGTYIEPDPSAVRSAGVPSMIQQSENLSLALETRQPALHPRQATRP